jgi:4-diphosphocytidyl-2-C-methyl-D-erythritol kinase
MPNSITEFARAKINLALHVLGRRADGYHELDSIVAFADVGDVLEITHADRLSLHVDGPFAADVPASSENLILKAHAALSRYGSIPAAAIHLTKNLPVASGIGGGSADAAAALRGFQKLSDTRFEPETIQKVAISLGSDVPVCLHGIACRMQGVGEIITPLEQLPATAILLVNPLQACSTAEVFRGMGLKPGDKLGSPLDVNQHKTWRNDMTAAAEAVLPVIADVLAALRRQDHALDVRMSGSGATCFALCKDDDQANALASLLQRRHPDWWVAAARLS